jgi:hypothetical protein
MIQQFWRLREGGEENLGPAITADGLVLGRTPLVERRGARFVVRERTEIERLLSAAYRKDLSADRLMPGLATVAAALNANDPCLAHIAAVHLRIPDLPNPAARSEMEAEDILVKSAIGIRLSIRAQERPRIPAGSRRPMGQPKRRLEREQCRTTIPRSVPMHQ